MRPGNREHVSHVAMHTPRTPLRLGRPSRVQRFSSSMHRAMEEDSLMIRHDDDDDLHDEAHTLHIHEHVQHHASQYKQKTQHPSHPIHKHTTHFNNTRITKPLFSTTAATQQTFPHTPPKQSLQQTYNKHATYTYMYGL